MERTHAGETGAGFPRAASLWGRRQRALGFQEPYVKDKHEQLKQPRVKGQDVQLNRNTIRTSVPFNAVYNVIWTKIYESCRLIIIINPHREPDDGYTDSDVYHDGTRESVRQNQTVVKTESVIRCNRIRCLS